MKGKKVLRIYLRVAKNSFVNWSGSGFGMLFIDLMKEKVRCLFFLKNMLCLNLFKMLWYQNGDALSCEPTHLLNTCTCHYLIA